MERNVEMEVAESVLDAFTVIFGSIENKEQRNTLLNEIKSVDINGEPLGRILLGIVVAVASLQESLTGTPTTLTEASESMKLIAESFEEYLGSDGGE